MSRVAVIGGVPVDRDGAALRWTAGLAIDADGAPNAYHPDSKRGLDRLANAGKPGDWWGLVTVAGQPVVQKPGDPFPGFYVSPTSLVDRGKALTDPRRYVDANTVPYLAIPPDLRPLGAWVGDVALVEYGDLSSPAIVADIGPRGKLGEGSMALARTLGIPSAPRRGGVGGGVRVTLWPGSSRGWPRTAVSIAEQVKQLRGRTEA